MRIGMMLATLQAYTIVVVMYHPELIVHGIAYNTLLGGYYEY